MMTLSLPTMLKLCSLIMTLGFVLAEKDNIYGGVFIQNEIMVSAL
jgi:hypothetical protein